MSQTVQAILDPRAAYRLTSQNVEKIEITAFRNSRRLAKSAPLTTQEARYSTAYRTAVAVVRGRVDFDDVMEQSFADPQIRRLDDGMRVVESDSYNAAFPADRISRVTLTTGGREALGDPERPVTEAEQLRQAAVENVDLVAVPELFMSG